MIRQIEAGLKRGHSEDDIIVGVIRFVLPVSSLRSYLDGRQDMSLPSLKGILKAHYAEKNLPNCIQSLQAQFSQQRKQEVNSLCVVLRTMDLRNKILFAFYLFKVTYAICLWLGFVCKEA